MPIKYLPFVYDTGGRTGEQFLLDKSYNLLWWTLGVSLLMWIFDSLITYYKLALTEGIKLIMRNKLYQSFIQKDMGYFDVRNHNPAILISSLAAKTNNLDNSGLNGIVPYFDFAANLVAMLAFCYT